MLSNANMFNNTKMKTILVATFIAFVDTVFSLNASLPECEADHLVFSDAGKLCGFPEPPPPYESFNLVFYQTFFSNLS